MNKIKKILLFLFLILPVTLFAKEYDLKDTNLKIALDSNWTVFTKDNIKDNSLLSKYDMTEEYLTNYMNKRDAYLDAFHKNGYQLIIRMQDITKINNLSNRTENEIKAFANQIIESTKVDKYDIYKQNNITYIKIIYKISSTNSYSIEYLTVVNNKLYIFDIICGKEYPSENTLSSSNNLINSVNITIDSKYKKEEGDYFFTSALGMIICGISLAFVILIIYFIIKTKKKKNIKKKK